MICIIIIYVFIDLSGINGPLPRTWFSRLPDLEDFRIHTCILSISDVMTICDGFETFNRLKVLCFDACILLVTGARVVLKKYIHHLQILEQVVISDLDEICQSQSDIEEVKEFAESIFNKNQKRVDITLLM